MYAFCEETVSMVPAKSYSVSTFRNLKNDTSEETWCSFQNIERGLSVVLFIVL